MRAKDPLKDYIKANRKASREAEIDEHKHAIPRHKVHRSKKIYDRKKYKAGRNDLPFFIIGISGKISFT